jgi:hypothetical protein
MRITDIFNEILFTIKDSLRSICIYTFILALFFGIGLTISNIGENLTYFFRTQFSNEEIYDQELSFKHAGIHSKKAIEDLGLHSVKLALDNENDLRQDLRIFFGQTEIVSLWQEVQGNLSSTAEIALLNMYEFTDCSGSSGQNVPEAFVSELLATKANIETGDEIRLYDVRSGISQNIRVSKIVDIPATGDIDEDVIVETLVSFDLSVGAKVLQARGVPSECYGTAVIPDLFDYPEVASKLKDIGILVYGPSFEELVDLNSKMKYSLASLSILLIIIGMASLSAFIIMHLSRRERYISLQMLLGRRIRTIIAEIVATMELIVISSALFSLILSKACMKIIEWQIGRYYGQTVLQGSGIQSFIVIILIANIFIVIFAFWIKRKVKKQSLLKTLTVKAQ